MTEEVTEIAVATKAVMAIPCRNPSMMSLYQETVGTTLCRELVEKIVKVALAASQSRPTRGETRKEIVAKNLTELRERPKACPLVELPRWLTLCADALRQGIEPNPDTVADYFERAATEITSLTKEAAPSASGRGMVAEEEIADAIQKSIEKGCDITPPESLIAARAVIALLASAPAPSPDNGWLPIETKPPLTECEERGMYTESGGLWFFQPTHWRPRPLPQGGGK